MIQLALLAIGVLAAISGVRAILLSAPGLSEAERKRKTGAATSSGAKAIGVVQIVLGIAMFIAGMTINAWIP